MEWGENEMVFGVHYDAWGVVTKAGGKSQIRMCGFNREKVIGGNKEQRYLGYIPLSWASGWGGSGGRNI